MKRGQAAAIIPSRHGSTRFPGKPLALINGRMLVRRVYERALASGCFSEVIIATDDERIARAAESFGAKAVMTSKRHRSGTDRVAEAARKIRAEIIVNIQGDEPLISPSTIRKAVELMRKNPGVDVATPVCLSRDMKEFANPNIGKAIFDRDGNALYFSRSPIPHGAKEFHKTFGLYAYRRDFLFRFVNLPVSPLEAAEKLEQLRILENGCRMKVVPVKDESIPVDVPADVKKVERYLKKRGMK